MSFFHRMVSRFSIRTKLVVSFLVVATIALVVGGVGTMAVHQPEAYFCIRLNICPTP